MDLFSLSTFAVLGFILAAYSVVANDSVQTLGTFMASNKRVPWQYMWIGASTVLGLTLFYSWYTLGGDISHGRLNKIPYQEIQWYHVTAPVVLLALTRFGIPVSTSFLVLSVFATSVVLEKMLLKSVMGYCVAAAFAYGLWFLVSKFYIHKKEEDKEGAPIQWRVFQWLSTALLWYMWLSHDVSNVAVFLPRELDLSLLIFVIGTFTILLGFMFYERGGKIQAIVHQKTNTSYVKAATLIDLSYAFVLWFFKMHNDIPMSTTWVFVGLLAGRELAIATVMDSKIKRVWPLVGKDFFKMMIGLSISVVLALSIQNL